MITLRESVRKLIEYQTEDYPDEDIKAEQDNLNKLYDDYTKKYGLISSHGNSMAFGEDSSYYLLCSLEVLDEEGNFKRKADMFSKRTIRPHMAVTSVDTASEALAVRYVLVSGIVVLLRAKSVIHPMLFANFLPYDKLRMTLARSRLWIR